MERRRQLCAQPGATCPPLTWTISNRLADFAPFLLQWYFRYPLPRAVTGSYCMRALLLTINKYRYLSRWI